MGCNLAQYRIAIGIFNARTGLMKLEISPHSHDDVIPAICFLVVVFSLDIECFLVFETFNRNLASPA